MENKPKKINQIEPNNKVRKMLSDWGLSHIHTPDDLVNLRTKMMSVLTFRPYHNETKNGERKIRWKRTGAQILEDGYVYQSKACTDLVVAFITLSRVINASTRFVKLKSPSGKVHSLGEFKLVDGWYIFDVASTNSVPIKGEITKNNPWGEYFLWKKGRDSWDLGLVEHDSINKINI